MQNLKEIIKRIANFLLRHEKIFVPLILLVFTVILCLPTIHPGYNLAHDTDYHIVSIIGLDESKEGKIFTRMWGNLGFGEGIFYPQLSHYVGLFVYKIVSPFASIFTAMKIANGLLMFLSGLTMYYFLRTIMGKKAKWGNILATLLYVGATYHVSCFLVRDAMAEVAFYIFIPVVALSLYHLAHQDYKKFFLCFVVGVAGCINSHLVLTIWLAALCFVFALFKFKTFFTKKNILFVILASIIALLITCSFWVLMLICRAKCDYYAFTDGMVSHANSRAHVELRYLLSPLPAVGGIRFCLDMVALILCVFTLFFNKTMQRSHRSIVSFCLITIAVLTILCTGIINIEHWPKPFNLIQFAWRTVTFSAFFLALATAICISYIPKKMFGLYGAILVASILVNVMAIDVYPDMRTNEAELYTGNPDYLPVKLAEYDQRFDVRIRDRLVIRPEESRTKVSNIVNDAASLDFDVDANEKTEISIPRIYYYGYEATLEYSDGDNESTPVYYDELGFATIMVEKSAHVKVRYTGGFVLPLTRSISIMTVSGVVLVYTVFCICGRNAKTQKHKNAKNKKHML